MRAIPGFGATGGEIDRQLLNDTGSNTMSLFDSDLTPMGIQRVNAGPNPYGAWSTPVPILTANGIVQRESLTIEIQLRRADTTAASRWIREVAIIVPQQVNRLSGGRIRNHFYFATAPGNQHLYVAEKKNGIIAQLPTA
jgi:hypothetical protein